jgi:hypothetical protein
LIEGSERQPPASIYCAGLSSLGGLSKKEGGNMPPLQTRRILLVDDDEVARQLVGHMLAALVKIVGTLIKL